MDTSETAQSKSPSGNCAATKNVKTSTDLEVEETRQAETIRDAPRDTEQVDQDEQRNVEAESEPEAELMSRFRQHPLGALFPRVPDQELRAWVTDICKHGQRHDIVGHPDGSVLDGWNSLRACARAGVEPRITTWDGKPGEELAFVISQNVLRRHLNESQRGMIACKLAVLPSGQRQAGRFAEVHTQAQAADMMQVSERTVRTARKVRENAPANVTRLVEAGHITLNAVESMLPGLSAEDKKRIDGMPDDDVEAEVKRLTKESATGKRRMEPATAKKPRPATTPPAIEAGANADDDDEHDNRVIGAEAVSRALDRTEIKPDTPERLAFVSAIGRLPPSDAAWASEVASYVEQEAREREKIVPAETARGATQPQ